MTPNDLLACNYRSARQLLHRMMDDLTPKEFDHQPVSGANSAAWIVGHLTVTNWRMIRAIGALPVPDLDPAFVERFSKTGQAAGAQRDLGTPTELVQMFDTSIDQILQMLSLIPLEVLAAPSQLQGPPAENLADAIQFRALHIVLHAGQISLIRRSLGKPPKA